MPRNTTKKKTPPHPRDSEYVKQLTAAANLAAATRTLQGFRFPVSLDLTYAEMLHCVTAHLHRVYLNAVANGIKRPLIQALNIGAEIDLMPIEMPHHYPAPEPGRFVVYHANTDTFLALPLPKGAEKVVAAQTTT